MTYLTNHVNLFKQLHQSFGSERKQIDFLFNLQAQELFELFFQVNALRVVYFDPYAGQKI